MTPYDRVVVIYNPNSTGDAPRLAEQLREDLQRLAPDLPVRLAPTQQAGHARDLAREASGEGRVLLVSVSGDGGYNEVVDGAVQSGSKDVVCAVHAAGNANDHRRATAQAPLAEAIAAGEVRAMDLLRLTVGHGEQATTRFAHSYIGVGLTPVVAIGLEEGGKGSFREVLAVVRTFARFRPFKVRLEDGTVQTVDSLVFANIAQMAKYASLSDSGRPDDGRFEVITLAHTAKWRVLAVAVRAATRGLGPQPSARHFAFTALRPMPLQLDGELMSLEAGTPVSVDVAPGALRTLG